LMKERINGTSSIVAGRISKSGKLAEKLMCPLWPKLLRHSR
jgi:hypothetical protein